MDDETARTLRTYERVADDYRDCHADRAAVTDYVDRFCDALPAVDSTADRTDAPRVLDVGCGPGWESATFCERGHDVTAVDLTPSFLDAAGEVAPGAVRARMDMRALGFRDDAFDGVWACASFLHVPREDATPTLRGFHRVLRPGGALFLAVKHGDGDWRPEGDAYGEAEDRLFTLYTPDGIRERCEDAGFAVEEYTWDDDWIQVVGRA